MSLHYLETLNVHHTLANLLLLSC